MVRPRVAITLLLLVACRTGGVSQGPEPLHPPLVPARPPDEARTYAQTIEDPAFAAEVAWLMGNDRSIARSRLDQGLAASPHAPPLLLRRALLNLTELDREAALLDVLALIEHAPRSAEAEIGMVLLYDWVVEASVDVPRVRGALDRSGLLSTTPAPPAHRALASAIAIRLDAAENRPDLAKEHRAQGGWLTTFVSEGPLAPSNAAFVEEGSPTFRGMAPLKRPVRTAWRRLPVTAGDISGVYRLDGCFELSELAEQLPVVFELHLPAAGRLRVDGLEIVRRPMTTIRGKTLNRKYLRLAPGWHCAEITVHAHRSTKPSLSVLASDGRPVILRQGTSAPEPDLRPAVGNLPDASSAFALVQSHTSDPDRALFGRILGSSIALSYWVDDVYLAQSLLHDTDVAAPSSAMIHLARARLMRWTRLPESLTVATLEQALNADPTHPAVLLSMARSVWRDDPERGEELIERLRKAAPGAPGADALAFRLARHRGWNAEAAVHLKEALARDPSQRLLLDGAQFYRGLDRIAEAEVLEAEANAAVSDDRQATIALNAAGRGDVDLAVSSYVKAAETSDDAAGYLARAAELELGRGRIEAARKLLQQALEDDPLEVRALRALLVTELSEKNAPEAKRVLSRLQAISESSIRTEVAVAALAGTDLGNLESSTWIAGALKHDVTSLIAYVPGTKTPRGLDAGDRWSRHKSVTLLDRVVDVVRPDGSSLSLRHSVTRLQTKEATDRAGEINLPPEALPIALRTLKPDGRSFEVDQHSGKDDLSFSGLAPGDAVERKWLSIDEQATPWGGYLRRFYFKNTSPTVRSDLMVVVPKGASVWTKSYNGAPLPTRHEESDRVVYYWTQSDIDAFVPEPHAVPFEEFVPFVVVSVNLDRTTAMRTNVLGVPSAARITHDVRQKAESLVAGLTTPEERLERIFSWVTTEIGLGGAQDVELVLASRRGERTGLFTAMLRAAGLDAQIALGRPGTDARLTYRYPNPADFNLRFVRVEWGDGGRRWARVDTDTPWLGGLPPSMRGGHYLLAAPPDKLHPTPVRDEEVERWPLFSKVDLEVDESGTAKGKVIMKLPGTFGADLREFVQRARKEEMMRHLQGWIGAVIPGARLLEVQTSGDSPLAPLTLEADILVGHFMVRDGDVLVAEQLFDAPLATVSLGLPTLAGYIRVPIRKTPIALTEMEEEMEVTIRIPKAAGQPIEGPRSFHRSAAWGAFSQSFNWDGKERTARLAVRHETPAARLSPAEFGPFREAAQEILQMSRNRLVVPVAPTKTEP